MGTTITPGGRVGDDSSHNNSPKENWVDKRGGLPRYIRIVRNGLMKEGHSEGAATALAVAAMKRWAKGGDNVSPKVQAAAEAALKQWEAMKGTKTYEEAMEHKVSDVELDGFDFDILASEFDLKIDSNDDEAKDAGMLDMEYKRLGVDASVLTEAPATTGIQYKDVGVSGVNVVDAAAGIVETIVSVTGLRDNVKDVIMPRAYTKTLLTRTPKGVWSHAWDTPVSKTLDVKELLPGSRELPDKLPNGEPWPAGAGALKVKTQFNLETQRGREAYSDVVFFGEQQEWSIGYQVPVGGAKVDSKTGIRYIETLELYEYSPVLFGAMPAARTSSVKDAQVAFKSLEMPYDEFKEWADGLGIEVKGAHAAPPKDDKDDIEDLSEDEDEYEVDDTEEKALPEFSAYDYDFLVSTRDAIDAAIKQADAHYAGEADAGHEQKSLAEVVAANEGSLGDFAAELKNAADAFDTAFDLQDADGLNDFGNDVLEVVEKGLESSDDNAVQNALRKVAAAVASMAPDEDEEDESDDEPETPEDEDDTEKKTPGKRSIGQRPEKKDDEPVQVETKTFHDLVSGLRGF